MFFETYLSKLSEFLLRNVISTGACNVLVIAVISILATEIFLVISLIRFNLTLLLLFFPFFTMNMFFTYVYLQQEKIVQKNRP